jgi:hypothetical protein
VIKHLTTRKIIWKFQAVLNKQISQCAHNGRFEITVNFHLSLLASLENFLRDLSAYSEVVKPSCTLILIAKFLRKHKLVKLDPTITGELIEIGAFSLTEEAATFTNRIAILTKLESLSHFITLGACQQRV